MYIKNIKKQIYSVCLIKLFQKSIILNRLVVKYNLYKPLIFCNIYLS
jgi:hypothetical protein